MLLRIQFGAKFWSVWVFLYAFCLIESSYGQNSDSVRKLQINLKKIQLAIREIKSDLTCKAGSLQYQDSQLEKVESDFNSLNLSALIIDDDVLNNIKEKTKILQDKTLSARKDIMNARKQAQIIETLQETESAILNLISYIDGQPDEVRDVIPQDTRKRPNYQPLTTKDAEEKNLPQEIIEAMKVLNYEKAVELMNSITTDDQYYAVIDEIYSNQNLNFYKLLNLGDYIENIWKSYVVYKSMYKVLKDNRNLAPIKIMKLLNRLQTRVLDQPTLNPDEAKLATELKTEMEEGLRIVSKTTLEKSVRLKSYYNLKDVYSKIYDYDSILFKDLLNETLIDLYGRVSPDRILDLLESFGREGMQIHGLHRLYDLFSADNQLQSVSIVQLAFMVRDVMKCEQFDKFPEEEQNFCKSVKDKLPESIRNAVFSTKVCVKDSTFGEYLYVVGDGWRDNDNSRTVFTWSRRPRVTEGIWKVDREGNGFYFFNTFYEEYLYAASQSYYRVDQRSIFTGKDRKNPKKKFGYAKFIIEPYENKCYLKTAFYDEYLRADNSTDNKDRRIVLSVAERSVRNLWEIENCD